MLAAFETLIGPRRTAELHDAARRIRARLGGGTLWHVNSTATGGGVAEMLRTLLPLYESLGVRTGWLVVEGDERFFGSTKRLGLALYGSGGGPFEPTHYRRVLARNAERFRAELGPEDVLFLHDHQTAGLVELLDHETYWRCHVGVDKPNDASLSAWRFLLPLLEKARGLMFSVAGHVPAGVADRSVVLPPFISPFSAKNREITDLALPFRYDPREPLVVQVSRWDPLKDMHGVLAAFIGCPGHLALVGPDPSAIPDDIEQRVWFERCQDAWRALPAAERDRISLVCLPMDDPEANALLVNAIQRRADVVVQKSLAEGFGLTVTEAMWKGKVVVASAVGGIREQITHGDNGLLVDDPADLAAFGALLTTVVRGGVDSTAMGGRARERVLRDFLPDREVVTTARLLEGKS